MRCFIEIERYQKGYEVAFEADVMVPMRDGVRLAADRAYI